MKAPLWTDSGVSLGLMDLTSKRMYDIFKDQVWKDLGPLDPNWFESLTAEGLAGHASDQDELCANQEGLFKTPIENRGPCSQMCSTPKLFKHHTTSSLHVENESVCAESEMLPWTKASPCVLQTETSQTADLFAALHSPKRTDADLHRSPDHHHTSFARHISERLGATVGDISWTSSLNTPPPEPSTLILSRKESSSTVTISEDTYVLARELFPPLSSTSADRIVPESPEQTALLVQDAELNRSVQAPMKDTPVPRATADVDMHNEVETENSTFCTMSSSILRKVRSERVNRRLMIPLKENGHGAVRVSPRNSTVLHEDRSSEPLCGNTGLSQWSPLSLSDIPTQCGVSRGMQDLGQKETQHEKDNLPPAGGLEPESQKFPASEADQEHTVDSVTEKNPQRPQLSLSPHFSQMSDLAPLRNDFSPAACLSALKRAKQRAKQGIAYQHCENISGQDSVSAMKQSSVHDSGFSSVAETPLVSSTNKGLFRLNTSAPITGLETKEVSEYKCQSEKDMASFKTASSKDINISPVSLTRAKHFFSDIEEKEIVKHPRSGGSSEDFHLTVSQKAEVKELCALLEQQSPSQFEFTQASVENMPKDSQLKQCSSSLKSETDFDTVNNGSVKGKVVLPKGETMSRARPKCSQVQTVLLKVESSSDESRKLHKTRDQTGNHFEGGDLNTCQGFKTASGERIGVSAKSLQKAQNFFKDCDLAPENVGVLQSVCDDENESRYKNTPAVGNVCPKEDISSDHNTPTFKKPCINVMHVSPLPTPRRGFKRSHDTHPVPAKSVKRAKLLLSDCEEKEYAKPISNSHETLETGITSTETLSSGFTTAGGKRVQLSKKDFEKVEHLWKDFDHSLRTTNEFCPTHLNEASCFENTRVKDSAPRTRGFVSAKGKALGVSAEALLKAKAMFDDIGPAPESREASEMPKPITLARGTENYTAQSTETTKAFSKSSDNCSSAHLPTLSTELQSRFQNPDTDNCLLGTGFTTGSGKKVAITEEALNGAKRLLTDGTESINELQDISLNKTIQRDRPHYKKGNTTNNSSTPCLVPPGDYDCRPILHNPDSLGSGFTTASGKKVAVSEEALNVAKRMLTEGTEPGNGLQDMAKGKIIPANEPPCKKGNSINQSLSPYTVPSDRHGRGSARGAASGLGRTVLVKSVLAKGLHNANTHLDNESFKAETPARAQSYETWHSSYVGSNSTTTAVNLKKGDKDGSDIPFGLSVTDPDDAPASNIFCVRNNRNGFTTASGKNVIVSEEALNKAVNFLTEKVEQNIDTNVNRTKKNSSFPLGHAVANLVDTPASTIPCVKNSRSGFTTASGKKATVSEEALNKAMNFLNEKIKQDCDGNVTKKSKDGLSLPHGHSDSTSSNISCIKNRSGFTTASGKKVTVSEDALNKAMTFLTEKNEMDSEANVYVTNKNKDGSYLPIAHSLTDLDSTSSNISFIKNSRSGFTTASGKKVTVSEEALNKAMNFLTEKVAQESDANVHKKKNRDGSNLPLGHSVTNLDDRPVSTNSCEKNRRSGFTTASGKKVAVSEEALNKAMNLLSEEVHQDSDANVNVTKNNKEGLSLPIGQSASNLDNSPFSTSSCVKNSRSGFTTASGNKVTVSEEALNKAKNFFTEQIDLDSDAKNCTTELMPREGNSKTLQCGFQPKFTSRALNSSDNLTPGLNPPVKMDMMTLPSVSLNIQKDPEPFSEYNKRKSPDKRSPQHCSIVNLDVPNLGDCSTTQQRFLAQEALDCTRALLEDEVRAAQSLTAGLEHVPTPATVGSHTEKRHLEDATDLPGLRGKSPEETDAVLDRQKESVLNPVKSCLSGVCKDRRVFQYRVPLHPNVTKSHRFGEQYVKTQKLTSAVASTPVKSGQADLKMPLFVPPFLNTRAKASKDNVSAQKDKEKPCTFVPPFKKLKTEGNVMKTQNTDGHFVEASPKTGTFTPPTRRSQNPGADCRRKQDAVSDHTNERPPQCEASSETEDAQEDHKHTATEQRAKVKEKMEVEDMRHPEIRLNPENLDLARDLQDMRIRKKSRQTIRPIPGSLFLTKSSPKRRPFRAVVSGQTPQMYSQMQLYTYGVDQAVCRITSETAEEFCFDLLKFYKQESFSEAGGVQLADGGWLVPRRDMTAGKEEFYRALCDTPGVDPKLLSQSWVSNHYRWVVWKLASMERAFPATMASVCLTPEQVLLQLKYRYDVEVDHSRRPSLRKIMERDDTSAKTLVLCVCGIVSMGQTSPATPLDTKVKPEQCGAVLWLTDGWYAIKAQLDEPLTAQLHKGAISEGVKLITHGAQLMGSQEACSPLEAPESLVLKIFANSTRRARWDTKLGFYKNPRPFVLPLSSVFSAGGVVCCVDMVVLRVYPTQWMERKPDGGVVFRSERAEEKEARRYNNHKQKTLEAVYAKIKAEFEKEEKERMKSQSRRRTVRREDLCRCQDGEELYEAVGDEAADVEAYLTAEQLQSLSAHRRALLDQRQAALQERLRRAVEEAEGEGSCPKRDTATVWRLCITDYRDQTDGAVYQLSIWNPSSDVQAALKEGSRYEACNLAASEGRTQSGRATVQLTSTRKTHFRNLQAPPDRLQTRFQPRVSVTFAELQKPGFVALCGEVDLTGCVLSITDPHGSSPAIYLVDEYLNIVKVLSVVSFVRCGWDELLELRALVCLSNLQVRVGCASPIPVLYAGDMSALSTHPRESHLRQALSRLQQAIQDQEDFFVRAEKRLLEIVSSDGLSFPAVNPRTPQSSKMGHELRTSVVKRQTAAFTPPVRTPAPPNPLSKKDPKSLKRRRALDYLCQFPAPPPLSHLSSGASPSVKKHFLPPRRSLTPSLAPATAGQTPRSSSASRTPVPGAAPEDEGWVHDDELALIDTQELRAADALSD